LLRLWRWRIGGATEFNNVGGRLSGGLFLYLVLACFEIGSGRISECDKTSPTDHDMASRRTSMVAPPPQLDGARVLRYAISQNGGFYHVGNEAQEKVPVAAMAICRYDRGVGGDVVYLFKCATDWDVMHDTDHASVDEAIECATQQAKLETPQWITVSND
jgi:hypothetical protein